MSYYSFLPPFLQAYPDSTGSTGQINDITRINKYLPSYGLTYGNLIPIVKNQNTGLPININGVPVVSPSGGTIGNPGRATPFIMTVYGQTDKGIVQFVLMKGTSLPTLTNGKTALTNSYYFVSATDVIDKARLALVCYGIGDDIPGTNPLQSCVTFYDYEEVVNNPNRVLSESSLFARSLVDNNVPLIWPLKKDNGIANNNYRIQFQFTQDVFYTGLFAGKQYNVKQIISLSGNKTVNYENFTGYGPGLPVNINYAYSPIEIDQKAIISNNIDTYKNNKGQTWKNPITLNVYNSRITKIKNYVDNSNALGYIKNLSGNSFVNANFSCLIPGYCSNSKDTYFNNNFTNLQLGSANYLTYQFFPISQLKSPAGAIVTDYTVSSTLNYYTLPPGISFTPSRISNGVPSGSIPVQIQNLISDNTNPNITNTTGSILSNYLNNPTNNSYLCKNSLSLNKYCGFLDYYDSLFGVLYDSGICGDGLTKGYCTGSNQCVPNFEFMKNYNLEDYPAFQCVTPKAGISTANMENYVKSLAYNPTKTSNSSYPPYSLASPGEAPKKKTNKPAKKTSIIFLIVAAVLAIILLVVIIVFLVKGFKNQDLAKKYNLERVSFE